MMNSGSVLVQNAVWSRQFLRDWWTIADRRLFSDQEQFDMLYQRYMKENNHTLVEKRIAILAPEAMNSDPPAMTQLRAHHQVLHLMVMIFLYELNQVYALHVEIFCFF